MKKITTLFIIFFCFGAWSNAQNPDCDSRNFNEWCEFDNPVRSYTPPQEAPQTRLLGDVYYIQNGNPWGMTSNQTGMDLVFGAGNWTQVNYSVDPSSVFNGSTEFIFIEGSDGNNDTVCQSFMTANQALIESWVNNGGKLYIKAGTQGPTISVFGNLVIQGGFYDSNVTGVSGHPTFDGPYTPTSLSMTGNSWCHNRIEGSDLTPIVMGETGAYPVVAEVNYGGGFVLLSGGTMPNFQGPPTEAANFHYNLIHYAANANTSNGPVIQCPVDIIVDADAGLCSTVVNFADAVAIDPNGGSVTVEQTAGLPSGSAFPVGESEIVFTATTEGTSDDIAVNGGFESGDFSGWTVVENPNPFLPWTVGDGTNSGSGFFPDAAPVEGSFLAYNGFDGDTAEMSISQDIAIPNFGATLNWSDNIDFELSSFGATQDRIYEVQIRDTSDNILEVAYQRIAQAGVIDDDNVWENHTFDMAAYAGQSIRITFWQQIPEDFTGPAKFALDNVQILADSPGGTSTCSFVVTVVDNQLPEIACAPVTVSLGTSGEAVVDASAFATATDNCDIESIEILNDFGGVTYGDKIYFTTSWSGGIWEANRDGTQAIQLYQTNGYGPVGIEADLVNGFLYWAEGNDWQIAKAPIDGSGPIEYLPIYEDCCEHHDLEIDYNTGDIYYTTGGTGLYKYDAATGNNINLSPNNSVYAGLSLDKSNGVLYFHDDLQDIYSINTDGSGETLLYESVNGRVRGVMYDEVTQNIYWWDWVNGSSSRVYYAPADGSGSPQILFDTNQFPISGRGYHMDLDPSNRTLYMTFFDNNYDDHILTAPIDGTSDPVSIYSPGTDNGIRGIAAGLNMNAGAGWSTSGVFSCDNIGEVTATIRATDVNGNQTECTTTITVVDDTAPVITCAGEPLAGDIFEDFEAATIPDGWTTVVEAGTEDWIFGTGFQSGGPDFPTNAATFDDDAAGSGNVNLVRLLSPVYDLDGVDTATLSFDYAMQDFAGSGLFRAEVWDGAQWVELVFTTDDTPPTPSGDLDVLAYANENFQVRFTYDDEGGWGWSAGVDNFNLSYFAPSTPVQVVLDSDGLANYDASDLVQGIEEGCDYTVTVVGEGPASGDLTTLFAGGNGGSPGGAIYFDLTLNEEILLTALDLHTGETGPFTVEMYVTEEGGTYIGNENNPGAWELLGTASGEGQGAGTPSFATFASALEGEPGTYGVALVMSADHGHDYTNGDGTNQNYATPELEFAGGSATNEPFSGTVFNPRVFNGRFYYDYIGTTAVENFDFDCSYLGVNDIVVTATDNSGNVSTCISQVEVLDVDDPILVCQDATVSLDENGMAEVLPEYFIDTDNSFDNCGITITAVDVTDVTCADIGAPITVTVFVSDDSGNIASCQATMTVVDDMGPMLENCPEDLTVDPGAVDLFYEVPDFTVDVIATDNCSDPAGAVTQDPAVGTLLPDGVYTVTLTSTDDEGNVGTCSFELTVESVLGVASNQLNAGVSIYPNPARNVMNIGNSTDIQLERAVIYDLNGRMIQTVDLSDMSAEASVNVAHLASGVYMVQLQAQDGQAIKRLVKE